MPVTANMTTIPAPIGGLNVYDNYMAMPETDALKLVNFVPAPYGCTVRKGYKKHISNLGDPVNTLVPHAERDGTFKLFAFAGTEMLDVTNAGASASMVSSLTSSEWQHVSVANSAGTHTIMFNGADNPIWYHDGTIKRLTAGNGTDDATWSSVDPANLVQGVVHQRRLWAVERNSTLGWFLAADSFYGVANFYDFGPFFKRGGYLTMLGTWSADVGVGADDHLVAVSSEGEVVVFAGTDATNATKWQLRGVYFVGTPPAGRRFMTNVGGDLLMLTSVGVVSLGTVLMSNTVGATTDTAYSRKVQHLLNTEVSTKKALLGWELHFHPVAALLIINIPSLFTRGEEQLVANYTNQAWTTFSGLPARCWVSVSDRQFFGCVDGCVFEAWVGDRDNADINGIGGTPITAECQQAYSYFKQLGVQKQIGMYKPTFLAAQDPGFKSEIIYDFAVLPELNPSASIAQPTGSVWGTDKWGTGVWSGGVVPYSAWRAAQGIGLTASLHISTASERETVWVGTDYTLNIGGPL